MTQKELEALAPPVRAAIGEALDRVLRHAFETHMTEEGCDLQTAIEAFGRGAYRVGAEIGGFGWFELRPMMTHANREGRSRVMAEVVPLAEEPASADTVELDVPLRVPAAKPAPSPAGWH